MVVVTTALGGAAGGCLVGFHGQVSIDPRRYAVWLSRANRTYRLAMFAGHLGVHFPSRAPGEAAVARLFGSVTGDDDDKLARVEHFLSRQGVPVLEAIENRMVMRRVALLDHGGDHVCFVGEPVEVSAPRPQRPLRLSEVSDVEPGHPGG